MVEFVLQLGVEIFRLAQFLLELLHFVACLHLSDFERAQLSFQRRNPVRETITLAVSMFQLLVLKVGMEARSRDIQAYPFL